MHELIVLSKTSKMPCNSFSISAQECNVGSKLANIPGSVCADCYARKNLYNLPVVKNAHARNLELIEQPDWVERMVASIKGEFFRWHDSGDVQSMQHLENIVEVANRMPHVKFWLPTKELPLVTKYLKMHGSFPANLTVRVSAYMIDGLPPSIPLTVSTVRSIGGAVPVTAVECKAPKQDGKCQDCRACWDKNVKEVNYLQH